MVAVGSLSIKGGLDTSVVERGFNRVKNGFREVAQFGKSVTSDLTRMATESKALSNAFSAVGAIGAGAFINLAKGAPAVAGSMARISIETDRLQRALGVALAPAFEKFVGIYTKFVGFVEAHPNLSAAFTLGAGALAGITAISSLFGLTVTASVLTALGSLALIGAVGFGGFKGLEFLKGKGYTALGLDQGDITPQMTPGGFVERVGDFIRSKVTGEAPAWQGIWDYDKREITNDPNFQIIKGRIDALPEKDRRFWLLELWDNAWS